MNSLSWFIYGIQVADELRTAFSTIGIILGVGFAIAVGFSGLFKVIEDDDSLLKASTRNFRKWGAATVAIMLIVATIIPSRQTLLLIAGSEIGQRVVTSEQVQSIVDPGAELLREWIKSETERLRGGSKK